MQMPPKQQNIWHFSKSHQISEQAAQTNTIQSRKPDLKPLTWYSTFTFR